MSAIFSAIFLLVYVSTGTLKGALTGAISGAAFAGVGNVFSNANGFAASRNLVTTGVTAAGKTVVTGLTTVGHVAKTLAHGIVGGSMSILRGGSFKDGFVSAGVSQAFAPAIADNVSTVGGRIVASSLLGGTTSKLTGGSFEEGAITSAFSAGFNEALHPGQNGLELANAGDNEADLNPWTTAQDEHWRLNNPDQIWSGSREQPTYGEALEGISYFAAGAGGALRSAATARWWYRTGHEVKLGKNWRIAPFGNRTGHASGRYPHYHRRGPLDLKAGGTKPGQGIDRHRPWDTKSTDKSIWDKF